MAELISGLCGAVLVLWAYASVMHTVFAPQGQASWTARGVLWVVTGAVFAIARRLPERLQRTVLSICAPLCLFITGALWMTVLAAGFGLLLLAADPAGFSIRDMSLRIDGVVVLLAFGWAMSATLVLAAFASHLVRFTGAYSRREVPVARLAGQAMWPTDTDYVLASYLRNGSRDHLDGVFAAWSEWLADVRCTHLGYPALVYYRSSGELNWLKAAVIILDAAALTEAIAPGWAPPHTRSLIETGGRTMKDLSDGLGLRLPNAPVSLHGREERSFEESIRIAVIAGLPQERDEIRAWEAFQSFRTRYAPQVAAISQRLMYRDDVPTEAGRRTFAA